MAHSTSTRNCKGPYTRYIASKTTFLSSLMLRNCKRMGITKMASVISLILFRDRCKMSNLGISTQWCWAVTNECTSLVSLTNGICLWIWIMWVRSRLTTIVWLQSVQMEKLSVQTVESTLLGFASMNCSMKSMIRNYMQ